MTPISLHLFCYLIDRNKWSSYVVPYVPTFMDGWTPDATFFPDEDNKRSNVYQPFPWSTWEDINTFVSLFLQTTRYSSEFFYDSYRGDRRL